MWERIVMWAVEHPEAAISLLVAVLGANATIVRWLMALSEINKAHMQANEDQHRLEGSARAVKHDLKVAPLSRLARDIVTARAEQIDGRAHKQPTKKQKVGRAIKMLTPNVLRWGIGRILRR